ncbi:hypothetical protein [Macrococcus carouselicus]|uniref:Uncharacterized protein n=1 Tax=Macrococcus carouselicus TaxID=69969 RepID=A0A9Q8FPX7_9STAP|nr:hypothetical protein [Macrococcus carouselicus]TDM00810.1 hypothetical protein ERX40_08340 [Macrococcus carouselicus]
MENRKKAEFKWNTLYRVMNYFVIILIIAQFVTSYHLSLYIILSLAALLILGLLDSIDHHRFKENKGRHLFDAVILVFYTVLTYI